MNNREKAKALYLAISKEDCRQEYEAQTVEGYRDYLGASQVSGPCDRRIFLGFRKAHVNPPLDSCTDLQLIKLGERIRLFDRGRLEEDRFIDRLRLFFERIDATDPETGKQYRVSNFAGVFSGSMDAQGSNLTLDHFVSDGKKYMFEFKTHNDQSFDKIAGKKTVDGDRPWAESIRTTKTDHYDQIQLYLFNDTSLDECLYVAVNKNTDEWYLEFVPRDIEYGRTLMERVQRIILATNTPDRMQYASEVKNFYCSYFCDMKGVCFGRTPIAVSCRTCESVRYDADGARFCNYHYRKIEKSELAGCSNYTAIKI